MKPKLTSIWENGWPDLVPTALQEAVEALPASARRCERRYWRGVLAMDTPHVHVVHILHWPSVKAALVAFSGKGIKQGAVTATRGTIEKIKRRIEDGTIASAHAPEPWRNRNKNPAPEVKALQSSMPTPHTNKSKNSKAVF